MTAGKPTPFLTLTSELRSIVDRAARENEVFEVFIARCEPKDVGSLPLQLAESVRTAERLAELYALLRDLMPFEAEVRAIAARGAVRGGEDATASVTVIVDRDHGYRILEGGPSAVA